MKETKEWFEVWFDTDEYHTLYGHRDTNEALTFVGQLVQTLSINPCKILDAGCGAGRHVHVWSKMGFQAHGFDLSPNSINLAIKTAYEQNLDSKFSVLDLRKLKDQKGFKNQYDIVTNLFTSFGYFPNESEHIDVVEGFAYSLKVGGMLVLDYINAPYSKKRLVVHETIIKGNTHFEITRNFKDGFFAKTISYNDPKSQTHTELVKAWSPQELSNLLTSVGLHVKHIYGDYSLNDYHEDSPRMILIAEKK